MSSQPRSPRLKRETTMAKNDGLDPERRKLRKLLKGFRVAMLTTLTPDGALRSRPMATVPMQDDGDVWLLTRSQAPKVGEVEENHRVNLNYTSDDDDRYVSLSGTASVVRDQQRIADLWKKRHRKWFPEGKNDPDLAALQVRVERAEYWDAGEMVVLTPAGAPAPTGDEPGAASRIADAMKALVTGTENQTEEKDKDKQPRAPGGAQG
jgi:general stress protein 26